MGKYTYKKDAFILINSMATGNNTVIVEIHRGMRVALLLCIFSVSLSMRSRQ